LEIYQLLIRIVVAHPTNPYTTVLENDFDNNMKSTMLQSRTEGARDVRTYFGRDPRNLVNFDMGELWIRFHEVVPLGF
jgi:hypothetical protein